MGKLVSIADYKETRDGAKWFDQDIHHEGQRPKSILKQQIFLNDIEEIVKADQNSTSHVKMVEYLAYVQQKNDRRWQWTRYPSKYVKFWSVKKTEQGVCSSKEEAIAKCEEAWKDS